MSGKSHTIPYPYASCDKDLANNFATFFKEKIDKISATFGDSGVERIPNTYNANSDSFHSFAALFRR